jgi:nuclear pore complex protein Nup155
MKDESSPDLEQLMYQSSATGEYRSLETSNIRKQHSVLLPPSLLEQLAEPEFAALSGIFSEINRAWFTVDNRIYLWNYKNQSDVVLYDGLDQVILSVALVRPREGVFVDEVKWLLILTTPVEILILAVTFEDTETGELLEPQAMNGHGYSESQSSSWRRSPNSGAQGDLKLTPTKFAVPTDNVNMLKVIGTSKGRIFMTGRDGSLNELMYQPEDGWFSRKCRKLNHTSSRFTTFIPSFLRFQIEEALENVIIDEQRNILYTLSSTNQLSVYDLGVDGENLLKIETLTSLVSDVTKTATQRFEGLDKNSLDIVSMHIVEPSESLNVHLVCVTRGGHRLYFSTYGRSSAPRFNPSTRPKRLQLLHVRFPPSLAEILPPGEHNNPKALDSSISFYHQGMFLCAHIQNDANDCIISTASDTTAIANAKQGSRQTLPETPEAHLMNAKVLALAESPLEQLLNPAYLPLVNGSEAVARNELAQQHALPPRQLVVLTTSGLHLWEKTRTVEHLKDLLVASRGADSQELRKFFGDLGSEQACAMCLVVATSAMSPSLVAGEATVANVGTTPSRGQRLTSARREPDLVSWATTAFFRLGGRPSILSTGEDAGGMAFSRVSYSGSHDGFALFLARLLQPLWASNLFSVKEAGFTCRLNREQFAQLEWHLVRLLHFLKQNQQFAAIRRPNEASSRMERTTHTLHEDAAFEEALKSEQQSLSNLHLLLLRCLEALAFLSIISETDLKSVQLSRVTKPKIGSFKFKDLVVSSDPEIVRELIHGITNVYSQQSAVDSSSMTVEELTSSLRLRCPSFFSDTDKTRLKAMDLLFKARSPSEHLSWFERVQLLQQSLVQFKAISSDILNILPGVCHDFQHLNYFEGVVELSLECAKSVDPNGSVINWYKMGQRPSDVTKDVLPQLEECYLQIIYVLNELYGLEETGSQRGNAFSNSMEGQTDTGPAGASAGSGRKSGGDIVARPELSESEWRQLQTRTLKVCRASTDEAFHIAFYQWYIDQNLATEMLQQETQDLEPFLRFYCKPAELRMHLLWQFYLHRGELTKAAHILLQLADQHGNDQNLSDRLGHLAQALSLIKASPGDHQLLREVQEKVDVGAVQLKIYNELEMVANTAQRGEARRQLDFELFTISDLFNQFAKRFGLSESALAILHVSGHQDARLARRLWDTMISDAVHQMRAQGPPYNTTPLAETVFNLASEYYPSEYVLPLDFLVDSLEQVACTYPADLASPADSSDANATWHHGWVVATFLRAQIPAPVLFKIYTQLLEARSTFWIIPEHTFHLAAQIAFLLEAWVNELPSEAVRTQESKAMRAKVDSAIDKHATFISKSFSSPRAAALTQRLRNLKRQHH